jgi:hypothetical protein
MPDVVRMKETLARYIMEGYSPSWAIAKVVNDNKLTQHIGRGNAWIDDIVHVYKSHF